MDIVLRVYNKNPNVTLKLVKGGEKTMPLKRLIRSISRGKKYGDVHMENDGKEICIRRSYKTKYTYVVEGLTIRQHYELVWRFGSHEEN